MILFRIKEFIWYLLFSHKRGGHGIHSPFIYDLVDRVFRNKPDLRIVNAIKQRRKMLLADKSVISVEDFGYGSMVRKNNRRMRKVSDIARFSSVPERYGILLSNLAAEYCSDIMIELGTSLGISTMYMAMSSPGSVVHTIEGSSEIAELAFRNFRDMGLDNIHIHTGTFQEKLPELLETIRPPGLVFIDGDHRKESLTVYFAAVAEKADEHTVVVIDDIYLSPAMKMGWGEIKKHPRVSLTVDLFRCGLVFFKKGMLKHDLIIMH